MDAPQNPTGPVSTPPKRRSRLAIWVILALGIFTLAIVLSLFVVFTPGPKVVWLTPAEVSKPAGSTMFKSWKFRLAKLVWPMVGRFWPGKTSIRIDSSCLTLSAIAGEQTGLGAPFATNADGLCIWVLSPIELASLQRRLKDLPGASFVSSPRIQTANGMQAEISVGGPTNRLTVDVLPKVVSSSIRLTVSVTATEWPWPPGKPAVVKTNLAAACRALVPNSGGLVMRGVTGKDASGDIWWFIASPVKVDARGVPIKP